MKIINVCLFFLELKLSTKQGTAKDRTRLFMFIKCIRKIKEKNSELAEDKKWNKLIIMIKRILWEFNLYRKFMCTEENNDKNK